MTWQYFETIIQIIHINSSPLPIYLHIASHLPLLPSPHSCPFPPPTLSSLLPLPTSCSLPTPSATPNLGIYSGTLLDTCCMHAAEPRSFINVYFLLPFIFISVPRVLLDPTPWSTRCYDAHQSLHHRNGISFTPSGDKWTWSNKPNRFIIHNVLLAKSNTEK